MANQSYLSVWCKDFSEERMLGQFGNFLETVPYSSAKPGFNYLSVRAVSAAETPIIEHDLRTTPLNAAGIAELAREGLHSDSAFEVRCNWDLWVYDWATGRDSNGWKREPQSMEILCHGQDYDDGLSQENGHFMVNFGFEHVFTGHSGLLGIREIQRPVAESPEEARFLERMAWPENLEKYRSKTRENIRQLFDWVRRIEKAVPVDRIRLWSEGEENLEARLEEILLAR